MKKTTKIWIGVTIAMVLLAAVWGFDYYSKSQEPIEDTPEIQTAKVRQGNLEILASGVGTIIPSSEIDLSFGSGGLVGEIFVRVGDRVSEGDILAKLGDITKLLANLASAELEVVKAEQSLSELYTQADIKAAIAQVELAKADEKLQDAKDNYYFQQLGNRSDDSYYAQAYANLLIAESRVTDLQIKFNNEAAHLDEDNLTRANLLVALEAAKDTRDSYKNQLLWFESAPSDIEQAILEADVIYAEAVFTETKRVWETLKDGPDPYEIILADAKLADAKAKLALAENDLSGATLVAPMNGTILEVNAEVGEMIGTNPMVTLANLDQPLLKIYLDESDFDKFDLDLPVEVIFDAFPDEVFTGIVDLVNPVLLTTNGVPTVTGLVQLDLPLADKVQRLPIGSNASIDVISAKTEGAILVPVEALREISEGEYAVFVMVDGEPKLTLVEVGLIDISYAEIISGIEIGDVVSTGIVETE